MLDSRDIIDGFPSLIKDPESYYEGVDSTNRVICRNVIVFERLNRRALQQQHLANRMHHRYVLIRVLKTPGVVSVDGQSIQLNHGDSLLIMPYQFHHFIDLESEDLRWLIVTFDLQQGHAVLDELSYRRLQSDSCADSLWKEVVRLWLVENAAVRTEVMCLIDRLITHLKFNSTVNISAIAVSQVSSKNEWISQIEALIIRSVSEGWTFEEVAKRAGFSERHLRNLFEQQMGLSLREYRSNYQFHRAISLMRDSNRTLSDVAELSGFNSPSVFTRFIRRMSNRTPRELCNEIREKRYDAIES